MIENKKSQIGTEKRYFMFSNTFKHYQVYNFMLLNSNSNYLLKLAKTDSDSH
jgi:hypothetical protein